jgi:hypothetical protein
VLLLLVEVICKNVQHNVQTRIQKAAPESSHEVPAEFESNGRADVGNTSSESDDETVVLSEEIENSLLLNSPTRPMDLTTSHAASTSHLSDGDIGSEELQVVDVLPAIPLPNDDVVEIPFPAFQQGPSGFVRPTGRAPRVFRPAVQASPERVPMVQSRGIQRRNVTRYLPRKPPATSQHQVRRYQNLIPRERRTPMLPDLRYLQLGKNNYRGYNSGPAPPFDPRYIGPSRFRPFEMRTFDKEAIPKKYIYTSQGIPICFSCRRVGYLHNVCPYCTVL